MLGSWLRRKRALSREEESLLVEAIRRAEQGNRGEVRVHIEPRSGKQEPLARAAAVFEQLGMRRTAADTGVLLYVAVKDRKAAVFAGKGIHGAAQPAFWQEVVDTVAQGFKQGQSVPGMVSAVDRIGGLLRQAVPGEDTAGNELPDTVSQG